MNDKLNKTHIKIFVLAWLAYAFAYLGRVNLSIALPLMKQSGIFDITLLGFVGTSFFWVYAIGQLINGRLGDRIRLDIFVFIGLFVSGITNILVGQVNIVALLIILWAVNGLFQSMLWGPFMRIISKTFPSSKQKNAGLIMFVACIVGYLLTYLGLSNIIVSVGFRYAFIIPGIILFIYSFIWLFSNRKLNVVKHIEKSNTRYITLLKDKSIILLILFCIPLGFFREGVLLFGPLYLVKIYNMPLNLIMNQAILIPILNLAGVLLARYLSDKIKSIYKVIGGLFIFGLLNLALVFIFADINITLSIIFISMCSASLYGTTSLITSTIPIRHKMTSSLAGLLDFWIYFGAGLSGFAITLIA